MSILTRKPFQKTVEIKEHSIYEIIECLHKIGIEFNKQIKNEFIGKVLHRNFIQFCLKKDIPDLKFLDYFCYSFEKDIYSKYFPCGYLTHHIHTKTWEQDFLDLVFGILYKNINKVYYDKNLADSISLFIDIFKKLNSELYHYYLPKVKLANKRFKIADKFPALIIQSEIINNSILEDIDTFIAHHPRIKIFIFGNKLKISHQNITYFKNINHILKNIRKMSRLISNVGILTEWELYYKVNIDLNHNGHNLVDFKTMPFETLFINNQLQYRKEKTIFCSNRLDDEFEYLTKKKKEYIILKKIQRIVNISREKSKFYGDSLKDFPNNITKNNFRLLPFLEPEILKNGIFPHDNWLLTNFPNNSVVFNSGGTTGLPKYSYRTFKDQESVGHKIGKGLLLQGFNRDDVVANLFAAGNLWAGFQTAHSSLQHVGCCIIPLGADFHLPEIMTTLINFQVNTIIGPLVSLLAIAKYIQTNPSNLQIKKIFTAGERVSNVVKDYLIKTFQLDIFSTAAYAAIDVGAIGYQCAKCDLDIYHINEDQVYIEVIDPDTRQLKPIGESGELVVTHLERDLMPIIRYRFGDWGHLLPNKCSCGRNTQLLQLMGRADDLLIIGGFKINLELIEEIIQSIHGLSFNFQIILEEIDYLDQFTLIIEAADSKLTQADQLHFITILKEKFIERFPSLQHFYEVNSIKPAKFIITTPNTLKRNPRSGKLPKIVDKRKTAVKK